MRAKLHQPTLRVIKILKELRNSEKGLSLAEIARSCEIMPGTLHPIIKTLCECKICEFKNRKYFLIDDKLLYERRMNLITNYAQELANELKLSAQVGVLKGASVLYERKIDGGAKVALRTKVGDYAPAHATALGKALLSGFTHDKERFFAHLKLENNKLAALSASTICDPNLLYENILMYEHLGYFSERGEFDEDFVCFAAPIKILDETFAALSVTVLKFHLNDELRAQIIKSLRSCVALINANIS